MTIRALFLNASLKKSTEVSNTSALIQESVKILESEGVECEEIRLADYYIPYGIAERVDDEDQWPTILEKILTADILVIGTAIWMGEKTSIATKVIERMMATSRRTNELGQQIFYNRIAGVIITGNEDGGKSCARSTLYALNHIGFTIPPQVDAYWVGEAGPGPSYLEAGLENAFTKRNTRILSYNLLHFARLIKANPIPAEGNLLQM